MINTCVLLACHRKRTTCRDAEYSAQLCQRADAQFPEWVQFILAALPHIMQTMISIYTHISTFDSVSNSVIQPSSQECRVSSRVPLSGPGKKVRIRPRLHRIVALDSIAVLYGEIFLCCAV